MGADAFPAIFLTKDGIDEGTATERDNLNMSLPCPVTLEVVKSGCAFQTTSSDCCLMHHS